MKEICFLFFLTLTLTLTAQHKRLVLTGEVLSDSLPIENVHIINVTTRSGTISNSNGVFQIFVKESDTLLFSDIQFTTQKIIIQPSHLATNFLKVKLEPYTNPLDEVVVDRSKISGGVSASTLNLPNADKKPLNKLERNLNHYSQASLPIVILGTLLGQQGGIDNIYNIISRHRKRDQKLKKLLENDKIDEINQEEVNQIRAHFTDDFYTNTLEIPKDKIDDFILKCLRFNIVFLFDKERYLEITNIFIQETKNYKNTH